MKILSRMNVALLLTVVMCGVFSIKSGERPRAPQQAAPQYLKVVPVSYDPIARSWSLLVGFDAAISGQGVGGQRTWGPFNIELQSSISTARIDEVHNYFLNFGLNIPKPNLQSGRQLMSGQDLFYVVQIPFLPQNRAGALYDKIQAYNQELKIRAKEVQKANAEAYAAKNAKPGDHQDYLANLACYYHYMGGQDQDIIGIVDVRWIPMAEAIQNYPFREWGTGPGFNHKLDKALGAALATHWSDVEKLFAAKAEPSVSKVPVHPQQ